MNIKSEIELLSQYQFADENEVISKLLALVKVDNKIFAKIEASAKHYIEVIQNDKSFPIEKFLHKYKLSSEEGASLMCLAEAFLRVPDSENALKIIEDKLSGKSWAKLMEGESFKSIFSSVGLAISGQFSSLTKSDSTFASIIKKIGSKPFIASVRKAMQILGSEFVIGSDINAAIARAEQISQERNFAFSFDLLGESARTYEQADHYYNAYENAIDKIAAACKARNLNQIVDCQKQWASISVKLSALHPRFELLKEDLVISELYPKLLALVQKCKEANISINFDAEEARRLDMYLIIIGKLIGEESLSGYNGIGVVVQAYQKRAMYTLEYFYKLAKLHNRKICARLVKGAYWDSEIKYAQICSLPSYPVYTNKIFTDCSYLACARKLIEYSDFIYPQFATHNALTVSYIQNLGAKEYEFQKLFGMGDALHNEIVKNQQVRIYSPLGTYSDLLAYLIRRILENGANTSFVNKVYENQASSLIYNIHERASLVLKENIKQVALPSEIYSNRINSKGYDLGNSSHISLIRKNLNLKKKLSGSSIIGGKDFISYSETSYSKSPNDNKDIIGTIKILPQEASIDVLRSASLGFKSWSNIAQAERSQIINKIADLYQEHEFELYNLLMREAGKTLDDAINEVREAIDFCRYYANSASKLMEGLDLPGITGESNRLTFWPRGVFACISPWNFPLAIFTGQIIAALVTGNSVIAKPAEHTYMIAHFAVKLMLKAGVHPEAINLVIIGGKQFSQSILSDERIKGVAFTGSTNTARSINKVLANKEEITPFIAETGGQNAMIVDSSALLEQVTDDVITSAFKSAGQRCSALRVLYVQEEIYKPLLKMLKGALNTLKHLETTDLSADIGPVISENAKKELLQHIENMRAKGFKIYSNSYHLHSGCFLPPHIIEINNINDIEAEKFGPILHIIPYNITKLDEVIDQINNYGFGLTFGIHSRITSRINYICRKLECGNIYINKAIIGAVVESQPFGGEKKSGTGFKAGGPNYLLRFVTERTVSDNITAIGGNVLLLSKEMI